MIREAKREAVPPRILLFGPPGSGKTLTALLLARRLCPEGKIGVIDTEQGSSQVYAGTAIDGLGTLSFDLEADLTSYEPEAYIKAMDEFAKAGYPVLVIDSISQEWAGEGGILDSLDEGGQKNGFGSWKTLTPRHNTFIQKILNYPGIVICTCRAKLSYVQEQVDVGNGRMKSVIRCIGLQPQTRDEALYEFGVVALMENNGHVQVTKTRYNTLTGFSGFQADKEIADAIQLDQSGVALAAKEATLKAIEVITGKSRIDLDAQALAKGNPPVTRMNLPALQKVLLHLKAAITEQPPK